MFAWKTDKIEKYRSKGRIAAALIASAVGGALTGVCSLTIATGSQPRAMFDSYFTNPWILALNLAVPVVLALFFTLLTNRAWIAWLLTNLVVMLPTVVSFFKVEFRGDPLCAEDLTLVTESKKMLETYKLFWDDRFGFYLAILAVGTLALALFFRGRFRRAAPRLIAALVLAIACAAASPLYTSAEIYDVKTSNTALINPYSENDQFISKGFVYPFLHTIKDAFHPAPDGYDASGAKAALDAYTDEEIPADKRVNVVAVMLEAYNDFSRFENLHFVRDVYGKYRELEAMGYAGTLMTDVFAGDTRVSEREFLTGLPYARIDKFVAPSNSYVWYFRENGYHTTGSHPCYAWFYNRRNINKNLGFAEYLFSENYFAERTWNDITYDAAYFPMLYELYESRDRSVPYFSYNITYQGHGPYEADNPYYTEPYVENGGWSEASQTILNNYLNAQAETTAMLYDFATQMLATDEPVVLVFFGDHKPWMGNGDSVYHELGINIDRSTDEGFRNYYSTRYLILANDAAKRVTGSDFRGEGETISASFLMNKVFELCGWRGSAYMQFTTAQMQKNPVVHRSFDLRSDDYRLYDDVTYYYRKNFVYES